MKKFIIAASIIIALGFVGVYLIVYQGADLWFVDRSDAADVQFRTEGKVLEVENDGTWQPFEMRGVDLGNSIPGHFATDYAIDKETYLRWFEQIKAMGANTIRTYMLQGTAFYEALYEFNQGKEDPLYLLQGVYLDDYAAYSHMEAYDEGYFGYLRDGAYTAIDAVHGNKVVELGLVAGTGTYTRDVSEWVIGYAVGVPWDTRAVAYTDDVDAERSSYEGTYFRTAEGSTAFEAMLAELADGAVRFEAQRYGDQKLIGIVNSPTTDPFDYPERIVEAFNKYAKVDIEHIEPTEQLHSGMFALYHVYSFDPDFARYLEPGEAPYAVDADGNTYRPYLRALVEHHDCPVVIGEYGYPSSRGVSYDGGESGGDQGNLSEEEQARYVVEAYLDIMDAGCAGSLVYQWQDEWGRRTWNTVFSTDQLKTPYWNDVQTADQAYGILTFDPGAERSVCYVDGNDEDWDGIQPIAVQEGNELCVQYDEEYVYFKVSGSQVNSSARIVVPLDTTTKSGSMEAAYLDPDYVHTDILTFRELEEDATWLGWTFETPADFMIMLDGDKGGCLYVQERYDITRAMMLRVVESRDPFVSVPDVDSPLFKPVLMAQKTLAMLALEQPLPINSDGTLDIQAMETFEFDLSDARFATGVLTEGNGNPSSDDFDSLADYCYGDGFVEIRIPWQLLNFSDPSSMKIHDDYYEHLGVEDMGIDAINVGVGVGDSGGQIAMEPYSLEGWGEEPTYHERLKEVYYALQREWTVSEGRNSVNAEASGR